MIKSAKALVAAFIVALIIPLASVDAASRKSPDLLKYIPADTPYVFASADPLPDKLADKFEPTVDQILLAYQRIIRYSMAEKLAELSTEEGGAEKAEQLQDLVDEVLSLMSVKGIREAGVQRDSAFAFYGHGLLPVLRFGLSDMKAFDQAIERIEEKAGHELSVASIGRESYKYIDFEHAQLIVATLDKQAVITIVPGEFNDKQLGIALGIDKPRKSLAKSRELRSIERQYGFKSYFTGFVNNERIASAFLDEPTGLNKDLLAVFEYDASELSDVCKTEFMELAGIAPRMVFGYSELNEEFIDSKFIVELRRDIAEGLATLPAAIPGLGQDHAGLMSFGFSMNPLAARQFYEARLDALEADPYKCEKLAGMQNGVAAGRQALNQPVPPVFYNFRGMLAVISDIQGLDMAQQKPPESVDASLLFAIENAQDLVTMAAMMDPQVAALNLLPDGKPVQLEMPQLATIAEQAFAAMSDNALSISVGKGAEANAGNMLIADSAKPIPFVSMTMDTARYYGLIGDAMMQAEAKEGQEEMPLAVRTALRDVMTLVGDLYTRMRVDVTLTPIGIEMSSRMILAD